MLLKQASQAYDCLCEEQLAVHVVEQMPVACLFEYMALVYPVMMKQDDRAEFVLEPTVAFVENTAIADLE